MRPALLILSFIALCSMNQTCEKKSGSENTVPCLDRFINQQPGGAQYVLPFPPGKRYVLSQTCCFPDGGHSNQLAYDFAVYFGDTVCCIRSGKVVELRGDQPDNGEDINSSNHNYLMIQHKDGTVAFYAHLMQNSMMVEIGDYVLQGDNIARSGNSGNTLNFPHLHIGLYKDYPPVETYDLPVKFKNADGPVDDNGRLIPDKWYTALEY